ncbi:hypothetical protein D3C72_2430220 [compost metagenome]
MSARSFRMPSSVADRSWSTIRLATQNLGRTCRAASSFHTVSPTKKYRFPDETVRNSPSEPGV